MAVIVKTDNPVALLTAIKSAIDKNEVETWSYDSDGDFTHTPSQWARQAWLRPNVRDGRLVFNTIPPRAKSISKVIYGVYHGRFIEMLLNHFDHRFSEVFATALPTESDQITPRTQPR